MTIEKHRVFISYHHANDQHYKNKIVNRFSDIAFIDKSVSDGDIDDGNLNDESIRKIIRDDYLGNSTVTIILIGTETAKRKHIDWEIYSSMYNGPVNRRSGILCITTPEVSKWQFAWTREEKRLISPFGIWNDNHLPESYKYFPQRIIDNLEKDGVEICVVTYENIMNRPEILSKLIDLAYRKKDYNQYDLSRSMRRYNS